MVDTGAIGITKEIYDSEGSTFDMSSAMWPLLMSNIFTSSSSFGSTSGAYKLKDTLEEKDFDVKPETDESGHDD